VDEIAVDWEQNSLGLHKHVLVHKRCIISVDRKLIGVSVLIDMKWLSNSKSYLYISIFSHWSFGISLSINKMSQLLLHKYAICTVVNWSVHYKFICTGIEPYHESVIIHRLILIYKYIYLILYFFYNFKEDTVLTLSLSITQTIRSNSSQTEAGFVSDIGHLSTSLGGLRIIDNLSFQVIISRCL